MFIDKERIFIDKEKIIALSEIKIKQYKRLLIINSQLYSEKILTKKAFEFILEDYSKAIKKIENQIKTLKQKRTYVSLSSGREETFNDSSATLTYFKNLTERDKSYMRLVAKNSNNENFVLCEKRLEEISNKIFLNTNLVQLLEQTGTEGAILFNEWQKQKK